MMRLGLGAMCSRWAPRGAWTALVSLATGFSAAAQLPTPLETAQFKRISTSAEISAYLDALAARAPDARKDRVGVSAQGRPIEALVFARSDDARARGKFRVMITGSQHGAAEPAGGEALMVIARDLAFGDLRPLLADMEVILLPNANPDGRDLGRRSNANGVNINTDFVLAEQPETRALLDALAEYRPDALLDTHESAVLKRETLAKEGYLTDFDAQFEVANAAGVSPYLRRLTLERLLPVLVERVTAAGLPAQRYIGEITSAHQPVTNGGLTLRNFRNTSGLFGAASFLVETKLDSREDPWPTYRNIAERVERQLICLRAFLQLMHEQRAAIATEVERARRRTVGERVMLYTNYVRDETHPYARIALRRLDTRALETLEFRDHRRQIFADEIALPPRLLVTREQKRIGALLDRHHIDYEALDSAQTFTVLAARYAPQMNITERVRTLGAEQKSVTVPAGTLLVDTNQTNGRIALLLLDPRSTSSVFRYPEYGAALDPAREHFVYASTR